MSNAKELAIEFVLQDVKEKRLTPSQGMKRIRQLMDAAEPPVYVRWWPYETITINHEPEPQPGITWTIGGTAYQPPKETTVFCLAGN